ncbi:hypothetical protein TRVL_04728 [Trypanosoma vivax]|nr:hypothetical protein TRVL_04728 [Trypanosoma vivax]
MALKATVLLCVGAQHSREKNMPPTSRPQTNCRHLSRNSTKVSRPNCCVMRHHTQSQQSTRIRATRQAPGARSKIQDARISTCRHRSIAPVSQRQTGFLWHQHDGRSLVLR